MKRTPKTLSATLLIAGVVAFTWFQSRPKSQLSPAGPGRSKLEAKHEPAEDFYLQRMGPDGRFHLKAYERALRQAKNSLQIRTSGGLDQPWTVQGPGNIGARVNTVAVNPLNEQEMYAGFSAGGLFKTTDGGQHWIPIFDDQVFLAIGDVELDPQRPDTIYVGTGDPNISGYPFIGDGLYRSTDGGQNWTHLGLAEQRIISKVALHPSDPGTLYVGCMGLPFEKNNDRGLYKSTDGGQSWQQVLFLSDSTGVIDLLMHPQNPDILYAAGWDRIRNNTLSNVNGQGARIYRSKDGGANWTMLEGGLPNATHSRIGMAIASSNPNILYAQYTGTNQQLEAIYRSDDGGDSWTPITTSDNLNGLSPGALGGFGWYFGKIRINPWNADDIFLLGVDLWRSRNAGQSWQQATPPWWEYDVHADKHDLIFTPSGRVLLATDGGVYATDTAMVEWIDIENIPATQFYRVAHNPHLPELYYGGAQDNGTTGGNVQTIDQWPRIFGGDGFTVAFDPINPARQFFETQNGGIAVSLDGGSSTQSGTQGIESGDRRNWDMPYILSPHDPQVLYTGTYRMYAGYGDVPQWVPISGDLTDGTAEPHRYHNISALDESPLQADLLFAGTGDGRVWRKDANDTAWTEISAGLPDQYVTDVKASPHDTSVVFVTHSGYRDNDFIPHIHRSDDRGGTWSDISANLPKLAVNDLLILEGHADSVLFVATDGGVYATLDGGGHWERLGNNMPYITVYDLAHNPVYNQLVAGTHARAVQTYPLDSLFQESDPPVSTFESGVLPNLAIRCYPNPASDHITLELDNREPGKAIELVVLNARGQLVHSYRNAGGPLKKELNISNWPAGIYIVKAKVRHQVVSAQFVQK